MTHETLAIVGSGVIATGLAACASFSPGHVLWARSEESAARAKIAIAAACERLGDAYQASNVHVTTAKAELGAGSFVVEAISEDLVSKTRLLGWLRDVVRPDALLATTTSSLCIETLAAAAGRPQAFVGLHVFNPVPKMQLVEIAFPSDALADTRSRAIALCVALGKEPIEVPTEPGFVVNNLLFPYLFSAVDCMERTGLDPATIDACMKLGAGHPMGPIALLDYIGLDISVSIGDALGCEVPPLVRALAAAGATGRKAKRGLYPADYYLGSHS